MRTVTVAVSVFGLFIGSSLALCQETACPGEEQPPTTERRRGEDPPEQGDFEYWYRDGRVIRVGDDPSWGMNDTGGFLCDQLFGQGVHTERITPPEFREPEPATPTPEGPHWEVNPRTGGIEYYDGEGYGPTMIEALPRRTPSTEEESSAREATLRAIEMAENRRLLMNMIIVDLETELDSSVGLVDMGGSPEALMAILRVTGRVLGEATRMGMAGYTLAGELQESIRRHPEEARLLRALPADAPLWRKLTEWSEDYLDVLEPEEARLRHRRMQLVLELRRQLGGERGPAPSTRQKGPGPASPEPMEKVSSPADDEARVPLRAALQELASMAPHCCTGLEDCERAVKALLLETQRLLESGHAGSLEGAFREARDAMANDERFRSAQLLGGRPAVARGVQEARDQAHRLAENPDKDEAARGRQQLRILDALERALHPEPVEVEPK